MPSMIIACRQETLYIEREPTGHNQDTASGWHGISFLGGQEGGWHCKAEKEKIIGVTEHGNRVPPEHSGRKLVTVSSEGLWKKSSQGSYFKAT